MKCLFFFFFCFIAGECCGQLNKPVAVNATVNFNFATKGLVTNDAGMGFGLEGLFFASKKVGALVETGAERFIGDKLLLTNPATGEQAGATVLYSIKAGPQFFITPDLAIAATYGPVWHRIQDFRYSVDGGFRFGLTGFVGKQKRFVTKLFLTSIPQRDQSIRYAGAAAGFRF